MTDQTTATVAVEVKPKVGVGLSTVAGSTVTLGAYVAAIVALVQGARDEATLTLVIVGTVALVTTIAARVAQAIAGIKATAPALTPLTAVAGRLAVDEEEGDELDSLYQRVRRAQRTAEEAHARLDARDRDPGPTDGADYAKTDAALDDRADDGQDAAYMTGDHPGDVGEPGDDRDLVPGLRETDGEPELDGDVERTPDLEELGVRHLAGVREVTAHGSLATAADLADREEADRA